MITMTATSRMDIKRPVIAAVMATGVTAGLLYLMVTLIANSESPAVTPPTITPLEAVTIPKPNTPKPKPQTPEYLKPLEQPMAPTPDSIIIHTTVNLDDKPTLNAPLTPGAGNGPYKLDIHSDQSPIPLIMPAPHYPDTARVRGIEGNVDVLFDITAQGTTENVRVLQSQPKRTFNRQAIKAVQKWKYRPQTVDGTAVPVKNVQSRVTFQLEE